MRTAIYPGSFDPVTNGHLNIITRAARSFDRLIVCVMYNCEKSPMFTPEERAELIRRVTADIPNVAVMHSDKLLADFAREQGSSIIIKGNKEIERNLYLRELLLGNIQGPLTGIPNIDRPWLKYYTKEELMAGSINKTVYRYLYDENKKYINDSASFFGVV